MADFRADAPAATARFDPSVSVSFSNRADGPADAPPSRAQDMFSRFGAWDWMFLGLIYPLLIYLVLQIALQIYRPREFTFDFMPLVNGTLFLAVIWGGVRLDRQLRELFRDFYETGSVIFQTAEQRDKALAAMMALGRRYGLISATVVALAMLIGAFDYVGLLSGGSVAWQAGAVVGANGEFALSLWLFLILLSVCAPVGGIAGFFIGKIIANGRLLDVLRKLDNDLSGFASDSGAAALRGLENIYAFATRASLAMCGFLGLWSLAFLFRVGAVAGYADWRRAFLLLWVISLIAFVFASYRPVASFRRRLDEIYGGEQALGRMQEQLQLAKKDMEGLLSLAGTASDARRQRRLSRQIEDLRDFITSLQGRTFRRPILHPRFLQICLVVNLVAFAAAVGGLAFESAGPVAPAEPFSLPAGAPSAPGPQRSVPNLPSPQQQQQQQRQQQGNPKKASSLLPHLTSPRRSPT